ncbi:Uncharacterised protein [Mycobacteroides abscessus subsp. abscessus]|nr:Uncharacterised protein [Mycobacteroides abscessus subsp. abscessus]
MAVVGVAARVDLGHRAGLHVSVAGVEDLAFADPSIFGPQVMNVAARALESGECGGYAGAVVHR